MPTGLIPTALGGNARDSLVAPSGKISCGLPPVSKAYSVPVLSAANSMSAYGPRVSGAAGATEPASWNAFSAADTRIGTFVPVTPRVAGAPVWTLVARVIGVGF